MPTSTSGKYTAVADRVSFTPQEHQTLNEEINKILKKYEVQKIISWMDLAYVLDLIIQTSKFRLQNTDIPHLTLLHDIHFMQLINRCIDKGEYDDIRRLGTPIRHSS